VVSPGADIRKGDRVVLKTKSGEVMAKLFQRRTATRIELSSINPAFEDRVLNADEVSWMARIVWARQ